MATKDLNDFMQLLSRDEELQASCNNITNVDELLTVAKKHGYNITTEEFEGGVLATENKNDELKDEDMKSVAGGCWEPIVLPVGGFVFGLIKGLVKKK